MPKPTHVATFTMGDTYAVARIETGENLTGFATPKMHATDFEQGIDHTNISGTIADATNGILTFDCAATLATAVGSYVCRYTVTDGGGLIQSSPDFLIVTKAKVEDLTT